MVRGWVGEEGGGVQALECRLFGDAISQGPNCSPDAKKPFHHPCRPPSLFVLGPHARAALDLAARPRPPRAQKNAGQTPPRAHRAGPPAPATSRYRGVSRHRSTRRWEASIWLSGKQVYLGGFEAEADAARAYDVTVLATRGPAAQTNFPAGDYAADLADLEGATPVGEREEDGWWGRRGERLAALTPPTHTHRSPPLSSPRTTSSRTCAAGRPPSRAAGPRSGACRARRASGRRASGSYLGAKTWGQRGEGGGGRAAPARPTLHPPPPSHPPHQVSLGVHRTEEDAARAYDRALIVEKGE